MRICDAAASISRYRALPIRPQSLRRSSGQSSGQSSGLCHPNVRLKAGPIRRTLGHTKVVVWFGLSLGFDVFHLDFIRHVATACNPIAPCPQMLAPVAFCASWQTRPAAFGNFAPSGSASHATLSLPSELPGLLTFALAGLSPADHTSLYRSRLRDGVASTLVALHTCVYRHVAIRCRLKP